MGSIFEEIEAIYVLASHSDDACRKGILHLTGWLYCPRWRRPSEYDPFLGQTSEHQSRWYIDYAAWMHSGVVMDPSASQVTQENVLETGEATVP